MPPSYAWKFSMKEFFRSTKVFSNEIFQYSETKTPTENRDSPPLSKLFRYPNLLQQERIPLQNFSALWDKKISIENLETPPPPSYP